MAAVTTIAENIITNYLYPSYLLYREHTGVETAECEKRQANRHQVFP